MGPNCPALEEDKDKETPVDKSESPSNKRSKDTKSAEKKKKKKISLPQQKTEIDDEGETETQFVNFGFVNPSTPIDLRNMILLVNQSTVDLLCNPKLVFQVWESDDSVHGSGSTLTTKMLKAHVKTCGDV